MKVLQIVKTNRGATWAYNQAKWLFEHGVDIITVLPSSQEGYAKKYIESGMKVICGDWSLPISKPWKFFGRIKEIRNAIKEINPDIVHLHFVTNVLMVRLALRGDNTPRLFQVPGPLHLESKFFGWAERTLSTKCDYWAGACKKTCDIYTSNGIDERRVHLAYYGNPMPEGICENKKILRNEFCISDEQKIVAMVSYFYKPKKYLGQKRGIKGHEDFIDAMVLVRKTHPSAIAVIIGNAWDGAQKYESQVIKYAKDRLGDAVIFTGYRSDVKDIYPDIDIAVHPSHSENLGGAAESLTYSVATIATNIGGFPDVVIDKKTGLLCPAKAPELLAEKIIYMIDHPEESYQMATKGNMYARELLDINNTSARIKEIYEKILFSEGD